MKTTAFAGALALGLFAASSALADTTNTTNTTNTTTTNTSTYTEQKTGNDQNVTFTDDPMTAPGMGPLGDPIKVRPSAVRMMLLRPRTQFIMQMLKSVENL